MTGGIARLPLTLGPVEAVAALERVLLDGLDVEECPARVGVAVPAGELLLMPAAAGGFAGVKVAGVAPGNPAVGLPRITGSYLLLDGPTLRPLALLDGAALTALRTPAVTALAVRALAAPDARELVVFGAGPQAVGHLAALRAVLPGLERATVVARRPGPAAEVAAHAAGLGLAAAVGGPGVVAGADVVVCCTTARTPLFDGALVPDRAVVAAVGSHEPDAREVDARLVARADLFVEARQVALREAGDLLLAGAGAERMANLAELVTGRAAVRHDRPRFFKSVGMAWQDLAVAAAQYASAGR